MSQVFALASPSMRPLSAAVTSGSFCADCWEAVVDGVDEAAELLAAGADCEGLHAMRAAAAAAAHKLTSFAMVLK